MLILLSLVLSSFSFAQSNLPPCMGDYWNNCFGAYDFPSGNKYVGQWKDNQKNGQGSFTFADGEKYVGQYKDNKKNGQGTYTFANGDKYVGQFKDDQRSGQGTYTFADGEKYVGQYKDGKRNGQGTYTWANGTKYVGQYGDDQRNGFGTYYYANGSINLQGLWRNNEFVQAQTPPPVIAPIVPKPPVPVSNPQEIKRQKCIRLGLAPGSVDFQQCMN